MEHYLAEAPSVPDGQYSGSNPWDILCLRVRHAFWDVLAFEHDGLEAEANAARQRCMKAAARLRARFDPHPDLGPEAADAMIAWQVRYARLDFLADLQAEQELQATAEEDLALSQMGRMAWRARRGQARSYV